MSVRYTSEQLAKLGQNTAATARLSPAEYKALTEKKAKPKAAKWGEMPKQTESQQQAECVEWFRQQYPQYKLLLYSVPNGGHRSKRTAATMQREGQLPGVPDQVLAIPKNGYHGLYIEQKQKGNRPTEHQEQVMAALMEQGYRVEVVYSTEEFKEVISNYLNAA